MEVRKSQSLLSEIDPQLSSDEWLKSAVRKLKDMPRPLLLLHRRLLTVLRTMLPLTGAIPAVVTGTILGAVDIRLPGMGAGGRHVVMCCPGLGPENSRMRVEVGGRSVARSMDH